MNECEESSEPCAHTGPGGTTYRILILCDLQPIGASTIADQLAAFQKYSRNRIFYFDTLLSPCPPWWLDVGSFDAIVIHYSLYALSDHYLSPAWRTAIQAFLGLKMMFVQDEYRQINAFRQRMRELGISVLFTCIPEDVIEEVYPEAELPGVVKVNTLTGYVPDWMVEREPPWDLARRPIDVGYRARGVGLYHLGELYQQKVWIGRRFQELARDTGLRCDISNREEDRLYGDRWTEFLLSSKCTLGTESGASVVDFTGEIEAKVSAYCGAHPETTFEEVQKLFLRDYENKIPMNQISPRIFEAIGCGCALVLFEGRYSGILEPDRHYIPLKPDFSNFPEVLARIRDTAGLQEIARRAFEEIVRPGRYTYSRFVADADRVIAEALGGAPSVMAASPAISFGRCLLYSFAGVVLAGPVLLRRLGVCGLLGLRWLALTALSVYRTSLGLARSLAGRAYFVFAAQIAARRRQHAFLRTRLGELAADQRRLILAGLSRSLRLRPAARRAARPVPAAATQQETDSANREFWDELCGSGLARALGIHGEGPEALERFDRAYLDFYPYLLQRVDLEWLRGQRVLEIGLGYGTLGQRLAAVAGAYTGMDIAAKPVRMMRQRLRFLNGPHGAVQGSALEIPFADGSLDAVVSIGCLHHTGDLPRCLREVQRVLRPGGRAYLMVYNRFSGRQWNRWPGRTLAALLRQSVLGRGRPAVSEDQRQAYDSSADGAGAPQTEFFSVREVKRLLRDFGHVACYKENCDPWLADGRVLASREWLLPWFGHALGLDIYIVAEK